MKIRRTLPARSRRLIGPWWFFDRFGPLTFAEGKPMDVAPHPHMGLQTVSWLLDGEVIHNDSLGCEGLARPGELNLMTAGRGIAHSEETPPKNTGRLNGVQLWVALPDAHRNGAPAFHHHADLPVFDLPADTRRYSWATGTSVSRQRPLIRRWWEPVSPCTPAANSSDRSIPHGNTQ